MENIFNDLFIFEMANNHQGSVEHGTNIIKAMGEIVRKKKIHAGVKFQYRHLDTFIHPDYRKRSDVKHIPRFLSTQLSEKDFLAMVKEVRNQGLVTVVTPFDEASVDLCVEHQIEIIKVASCSATDWPLLEKISTVKRPVIISTGGVPLDQIDRIVSFCEHHQMQFALMHCVALYPAPESAMHFNFIKRMKKRYPGVIIGYSGHEEPDNTLPAIAAVSAGAQMLERHVGLPTSTITLNKYSMNPKETEAWIDSALHAREICGTGEMKEISRDEIDSLLSLKRGVYAAKKIKKGDRVKPEDTFYAMPCLDGQLDSGQFGQQRATVVASRDYKTNEPLFETSALDTIHEIRDVIHEAKGMINEACIVIGKGSSIELSHHYGLQDFRKFGALIVNVINREYCKKLVVLLPNQNHPNHRHHKKEETFHLLWGDMALTLNDQKIMMERNDLVLVERGAWHSFTTSSGAIFEEVSTTHILNDSEYEDPAIDSKDPIERKTVIDNW